MKSLCIGFLGADWWGSDARAMAAELRRRGHLVLERSYEDHLPTKWRHPVLKVARRILRGLMARDYNQSVAELLEVQGMDFLLVFKGMLLDPATLARFKEKGIPCYCFYPDVSFHDHGRNIPACLALYDCVFTSKSYHLEDASLGCLSAEWRFAPHGFDPEVHRPVGSDGAGLASYVCDVSFVGHWSAKKEEILAGVRQRLPEIDLKIWGPAWGQSRTQVRSCWQGRGAYGDELAAIYGRSRINLGLLSEAGTGVRQGDSTTARSWQIPGAGGFQMHEDTSEIRSHFEPGKEIVLFGGTDELVSQIRYYLGHEEARQAVAAAGCQRGKIVPYTYLRAVDAILDRFENRELGDRTEKSNRAAYVGILTPDTTSRMRAETLRGLTPPWEWTWVDTDVPMLAHGRFWRTLAFRFRLGRIVTEINRRVVNQLCHSQYDVIWVDKGVYLSRETMRVLRFKTRRLIHYTPDTAFLENRSRHFFRSLPAYDFAVTTKSFEVGHYHRFLERQKVFLTTQSYDSKVHFPRLKGTARRREVVFVGLAERDRMNCLDELLGQGITVQLAGIGWERFRRKWRNNPKLKFAGNGAFGEAYTNMLSECWIGLGLMSKRFPELHTTRTFEIPACGAILATERTKETVDYFAPDEVLFFDDYRKLAQQIKDLFESATDNELSAIAEAGRQRVLRDGRDCHSILGEVLEYAQLVPS